jgi:DNA modification methylase
MKTIEENRIYNEPCLDTLSRIPDNYVDCVITSPPYWQLRDYGYEGQWGLEPTFNEYLQHLWSMMDEIYRVLKDEGTVWINLGDTYSGSGGSGGDYNEGGLREGQAKVRPVKVEVKNKCLLLIPHRFAIGCIDKGWIVRNDVIWAKRNGMPESVTDRFSKKHEYMFFFVKNEKYYFDLDAIRDKTITKSNIRNKREESYGSELGVGSGTREWNNPSGKNPGDVSDFWDIPLKPNSLKHYATYNESLISKPILAGCPEGGIIYDPFMGIGTTAICAIRSNRKFIGSEMSKEYCNIANKNIEPYLLQKTFF